VAESYVNQTQHYQTRLSLLYHPKMQRERQQSNYVVFRKEKKQLRTEDMVVGHLSDFADLFSITSLRLTSSQRCTSSQANGALMIGKYLENKNM
jgi:hypothetical protein